MNPQDIMFNPIKSLIRSRSSSQSSKRPVDRLPMLRTMYARKLNDLHELGFTQSDEVLLRALKDCNGVVEMVINLMF